MSKLDVLKIQMIMNVESKCTDSNEAVRIHEQVMCLLANIIDPHGGGLI